MSTVTRSITFDDITVAITRVAPTAISDAEKMKHTAFIKEALNTIDTAAWRSSKATGAKMLYDYLFISGMDFLKTNESFKQTVIKKAYEFKQTLSDKAFMIPSIDKVLTALDQPLKKPATPAAYPEADKIKHVTAIKDMLAECDKAKGKENKATIAIKLLDYVTSEALDFTKSHERFKNTVINKCYEFKQTVSDMSNVVKKADEVLTKLGASTTIPDGWKKPEKCDVCGGNHSTPDSALKIANEVIDAWIHSQPPIVAPKPVEPVKPKEDTSALDLALFTALAKKYNFEPAITSPKTYLSHFESYARWKHHSVKGSTKAEKMTSYFIYCTDDGQRIELMKTIFTKHNLIFSDAAMTLYYEWQKTYKPTGKTNRYIKMNEFATAHKALFTA